MRVSLPILFTAVTPFLLAPTAANLLPTTTSSQSTLTVVARARSNILSIELFPTYHKRADDPATTVSSIPARIPSNILPLEAAFPTYHKRADNPATTVSTSASSTATCIKVARDKNGYVPPYACDAYYNYYPSFGAAIAGSVIFGISLIAHIGQAIVYKKKWAYAIIMGTAWELASFVTRVASTRLQQNLALVIISQLLVLLAPLWINAFIYMILGRMIYYYLPTKSLLGMRASRLAICFVSLDIVSFLVQGLGGSLINNSNPPKTQLLGIHIYMGGIGLQEFFILIFSGFAIKFHVEMLRLERTGQVPHGRTGWKRLVFTLYTTLALITIRIIYRLIEFSAGTTSSNPIPYHEWYFYVFDGIPMAIAVLVLNVNHPGMVLRGPESELPKTQWSCCCCCGRNKRVRRGALGDEDYVEQVELSKK